MADPATRLLSLLSLLQRRVRWTGPELAEQLGITTRTLRRDIDRLRNLGYPVDAAPGVDGGYQLGVGGDLPPLLLDDDEATAVAVALGASTATAALGIEDIALAALTKLHRLLPPHIRHRVHALTTATDLLARPPDVVAPGILATLATAIDTNQRTRLTYQDRDGHHSGRRVDPYRLVATNRRWYLLAHDCDRNDWRTFRADRITDATPTGHHFTPDEEPPDAARMVSESITTAPYRYQATVRFDIPADELRQRIPPTIGSITDHDDHATLRIGANHLPALAGHLVSLDLPFEVLEPPELRQHLHQLAHHLASRHA